MTKFRIIYFGLITALVLLLFTSLSNNAQDNKDQLQYVGVKKCKMCHSSETKGNQYKIWSDSKHAHAYEALASDQAKQIGKDKGIDDPQKSDKCLKCHVTGYGLDAKFYGKDYKIEDGVTCEECHGAGEKYINMMVMMNIAKGTTDPASVGLAKPGESTCKNCHNSESPTFKEFNFADMFKKIAHPMPDTYKQEKGYK